MNDLPVVYRIDGPDICLNVPEVLTCKLTDSFYLARVLMKNRQFKCVIKNKGQQQGAVYGLSGSHDDVLAFAKTCKRNGFTVIRDAKGLT